MKSWGPGFLSYLCSKQTKCPSLAIEEVKKRKSLLSRWVSEYNSFFKSYYLKLFKAIQVFDFYLRPRDCESPWLVICPLNWRKPRIPITTKKRRNNQEWRGWCGLWTAPLSLRNENACVRVLSSVIGRLPISCLIWYTGLTIRSGTKFCWLLINCSEVCPILVGQRQIWLNWPDMFRQHGGNVRQSQQNIVPDLMVNPLQHCL